MENIDPQMPVEQAPVQRGMFLMLLFLVSFLFFGLIWKFVSACFWAAIFAILFQGVYRRLTGWLRGSRNAAAFLTALLILICVVLPIIFISVMVVNESRTLYASLQEGAIAPKEILKSIELRLPILVDLLTDMGVHLDTVYQHIEEFFAAAVTAIGKSTWRYTQNAIGLVVDFVLMLYLLYFWVRDGHAILAAIRNTLPIGNAIEDILFKRFADVARATVKGTVIVASVQGLMGGILFAMLNIQGAAMWGVLMGLFSLLPVGGSGIVWVPAAIILIIQGYVTDAIIIVVVGALGIGLIDNLLRPLLIGRDTRMPDYLVLVATLGGLTWAGLTGFIIGPMIAALFVTCWQIAGQLYGGRE